MSDGLKYAGISILRFLAFIAVGAVLEFMLLNLDWLNARLLPLFFQASMLALVLFIVVALPLSLFRPCRGFAAGVTHFTSYVFFLTLFFWAVLVTLAIWGKWAVLIGLFLMIVGVVPVAMIAALFTGFWTIAVQLIGFALVTVGARTFARWIADRRTASFEMS